MTNEVESPLPRTMSRGFWEHQVRVTLWVLSGEGLPPCFDGGAAEPLTRANAKRLLEAEIVKGWTADCPECGTWHHLKRIGDRPCPCGFLIPRARFL